MGDIPVWIAKWDMPPPPVGYCLLPRQVFAYVDLRNLTTSFSRQRRSGVSDQLMAHYGARKLVPLAIGQEPQRANVWRSELWYVYCRYLISSRLLFLSIAQGLRISGCLAGMFSLRPDVQYLKPSSTDPYLTDIARYA